MTLHRVQILDCHVGGEPVRVIVGGGPDLASGPLLARQARFKTTAGHFRRTLTSEPRGSSLLNCAMLCAPHDPTCQIGALFFDADGQAAHPGHGAIGLIAALAHRGDVKPGRHRIDTPGGVVEATLEAGGAVTFHDEPARRRLKDVLVDVPGLGSIQADLAWGGEWVFLTESRPGPLAYAHLDSLRRDAAAIRAALIDQGVPEADGAQIALLSPAPGVERRCLSVRANGGFARSPGVACASAQIARLAADGALAESESWRLQSLVGGLFELSYRVDGEKILPRVTARPRVYAETNLILDPEDPFCWGYPV